LKQSEIKARYDRDGFIFPINAISKEDASCVREKLEIVEQTHGSMHYVVKPYLLLDWIHQLASRKEILDPVKSILGEDLLLWDCEFIIKEPGSKKQVEWHQDLLYFGLDSDDLVTAWLAISPVTKENGCMRFVAGSHKAGLRKHLATFNKNSILARGQQLVENIQEDRAVDVALEPGQMSLHHGAAFHASGLNSTSDRRIAICFVYIKPSMRQTGSRRDSATLISGVDTHGNFEKERLPQQNFSEDAVAYQKMIDARRRALWREVVTSLSE
jgi:non-haem Fe2+, alpha-ketoglutarate-dependent halogenase